MSDKKGDSSKETSLPVSEKPKQEAKPKAKVVADPVKAKPAAPKMKVSKTSIALPSIALAVASVALLAAAYLWQNSQQQQHFLQTELMNVQQQLQSQNSASRDLQRELDQQKLIDENQQKQMLQVVNHLQLQLASQQKRLQTLSTTDRDDWLLAEAEYLMKLANQRLLMGKELSGAADLLAAADEILRDLDDSALHGVRQLLAEEITALKSTARFDLEGLYLKLGALAKHANELQLFKAPVLELSSAELPKEEVIELSDNWQQRFQSGVDQAWLKLNNYVQIKRRDEVYKPLLAPEYEAAVRNNLQLMFEQAQSALLSGKQKLYDDSLKKAQQWVESYYAIDEGQVELMNGLINNIRTQTITIILPDISASSRALKTYIETRHQLAAPNTAVTAEKTAEKESDGKENDGKEGGDQ